MADQSANFHAEGGHGASRWSYSVTISRTAPNGERRDQLKVSIDLDVSYGGLELHVLMSEDASGSCCQLLRGVREQVSRWLSRSRVPPQVRLIFDRFLSEELPARVTQVVSPPRDKCAVCWEALQNGSLLRKLHCSHVFHRECVDSWLRIRRVCPLCRYRVKKLDGASLLFVCFSLMLVGMVAFKPAAPAPAASPTFRFLDILFDAGI